MSFDKNYADELAAQREKEQLDRMARRAERLREGHSIDCRCKDCRDPDD